MNLKEKSRIVAHPYNPHKDSVEATVLVPIEDEIYARKFEYEALDVESVKIGGVRAWRVVCIPFVVYGINLGDVVLARGGHFTRKIVDDGQYGYRIAYPDFGDEEHHEITTVLIDELRSMGYDVEEFNHKITAVSAHNADGAIKLEKYLRKLMNDHKILAFDTIR